MRDRLIELIGEYHAHPERFCPRMDTYESCSGCKYDLGVECNQDGKLADHLLANGVIVLPVPVGGKVYTLDRGRAKAWNVCFIGLNTRGEIKFHIADYGFKHSLEVWNCDIGKTVFLTREEAEKALVEREGKG